MPFNLASILSLNTLRETFKDAVQGSRRKAATSFEEERGEIGLSFDHYHFTFGLLLQLFDTAGWQIE
jgi:hypothetical protein